MKRDHAELVEMFKDMPKDEAPMTTHLDVHASDLRKTMQSLQNVSVLLQEDNDIAHSVLFISNLEARTMIKKRKPSG